DGLHGQAAKARCSQFLFVERLFALHLKGLDDDQRYQRRHRNQDQRRTRDSRRSPVEFSHACTSSPTTRIRIKRTKMDAVTSAANVSTMPWRSNQMAISPGMMKPITERSMSGTANASVEYLKSMPTK